MTPNKDTAEAALEDLARRREAGEISEANFDSEVARVLALDKLPDFVRSRPASPPPSSQRSAPTNKSKPVWTFVAWGLAGLLAIGLIGTATDDQTNRQSLQAATKGRSELTTQVDSLQSQNQTLQSQNGTLSSSNQALQKQLTTPHFTLWRVTSATLPAGRYYSIAIPFEFSVAVALSSASAPMDVRFFTTSEFVTWYNNGSPWGGGEGWFAQTNVSGTYDKATGCADRVLVVTGRGASTFTMSVDVTFAPANAVTC